MRRKNRKLPNRFYKFFFVLFIFFACIYCVFFSHFSIEKSGCEFNCTLNSSSWTHLNNGRVDCTKLNAAKIEVIMWDSRLFLEQEMFQLVYESIIVVLLSICIFLSLLALEKMLIAFLLSVISLLALWILPYPDQHVRQFVLWLERQPMSTLNMTMSNQIADYCQ